MDDSIMSDSIMDDYGDSDNFSPVAPVKKTVLKKPIAAKAGPKKLTQTTLKAKPAKPAIKKRPKPSSDDEGNSIADLTDTNDASLLSNTPPSAKKQKKAAVPKKIGAKPLQENENDSMSVDGPSDSKPKKNKDSATDKYQKITQLEHIKKRPDTYIGSVERTEQQMWIFNSETEEMETRKVSFVPGLYKIFDEILVNAADNKVNDATMKNIKVTVDRDTGEISVENDGKGIPVVIHEVEGIYVPEMIFGHLLTSSNYDDDQQKVTGGRNGFGAKLCNIFSTEFTLETQDSEHVKRYKQTWTENMGRMGKASIKTNKSADFTRVTFTPDYKRFGMTGIDNDFEGLVKRRVYDMAGTVKGISVYLNGVKIKVNNFEKYMKMYTKAINRERGLEIGAEVADNNKVIIDSTETHTRWEIGFAVSDGSFQQVSFVNSIATTSGGTHVNYIADQICTRLLEIVKKKNKQGSTLKANQIRNHIFLFVNCLISNPAFTSQTKEQLTTKMSAFGSKCVLTDKFLTAIGKTDAVENILHFAQQKADKELSKSDGNRRSRMNNPKLVDANLAGTKRGWECTLILTEGDSAKGLAVAGRAVLDPDKIGVFPLRGKLLNVRDASIDQITKNVEIQAIKQFLGLKHKQTYTDTKGLRYGHLMIMADQDHDGSHIKGLLINFLQVQFPSLLKLPDFFREFITPIVKVWKGNNPKKAEQVRSFFTMPQYEEFKERHKKERGWHHKYFKGLGTSSTQDAQVYFRNLDDHLKEFQPMKAEESELFELAFSKKKADARKAWLGNFVPGTFLDHSSKSITYDDFVNRELILFSMADNLRSIPSVIDGLKPGQRKVVYACLNRPLTKDTKVVELAGYVSELTAYQHGEASLHQTIIGLAQEFVGSNNVNILEPSGNFGSRLAGGSDSASPRYIYTRLSPFARAIFSSKDDPNLEYNTDDDRKIEPKVFCPVVPLLLLNGTDGIGTGWSTSIPNYKPEDVVANLKRRMGRLEGQDGEGEFETMVPWFRGWKGEIEAAGPDRYKCNGKIFRNPGSNEVEVTELPIRVWTDDFKARLEEIIKAEKVPSFIKDYKEFNDHSRVNFVIQLDEKHMKAAESEGLEEKFKLLKTIATSNMVAFDASGRIKKYEKVEDILEEFYQHRLRMYTAQKIHWVEVYGREWRKLSNQARFVTEIIDNKLIVSKKSKPKLVQELRERKYEAFPKLKDAKKAGETDDTVENTDDPADEDGGARDYDYLLGLPIWSLTQERVDKLRQQMSEKKKQLEDFEAQSEKDLWCSDLDEFVKVWNDREVEERDIAKKIQNMGRRVSKKLGVGKPNKASARMKVDEDYMESKPAKAAARPKANAAAGVTKVEAPKKNHQAAFSSMFGQTKASKTDDLSEDDFDTIAKDSRSASEQPAISGRSKRAAAAKPKNWLVDDDDSASTASLDDDDLGNIDDMVKGLPGSGSGATLNGQASNGRLSLYNMSRASSSADPIKTAKQKPKSAFVDIMSTDDETNYEMLARSPQKSAPVPVDDLDSPLSDDELDIAAAKPTTKAVAKPKSAPKPKAAPLVRKPAAVAKPKPITMSPAAKAYAKKKVDLGSKPALKKTAVSDDDLSEVSDAESPPPRPAARGRPARAAAAAKPKKSAYVELSDDDEEMDDVDNMNDSEGEPEVSSEDFDDDED